MVIHARVFARKDESPEELFKRFSNRVSKSGILIEANRRRWHIGRSEQRRLAKKKAELKERKRVQELGY